MNTKIEIDCEGSNNQIRLEKPVTIKVDPTTGEIKCPYLTTIQFEPSDALSQVCTVPFRLDSLPKDTNPLSLPRCRFFMIGIFADTTEDLTPLNIVRGDFNKPTIQYP